jgi:hypothetical protein
LVMDHVASCYRYTELAALARKPTSQTLKDVKS